MVSDPSPEQTSENPADRAHDDGMAVQAVQGSLTSIGASLITLVFGLIRSLLLARWLLPEHFGIVALAMFFIGLVSRLQALGLDSAFIHRQDTDETFMKTFFTFRLGLDLGIVCFLFLIIPLISLAYPDLPSLGPVMAILIVAYFLASLSQLQETILQKNLAFASLNILDITTSVVMTVVAPYLAWQGWGIWALVAEAVSGFVTRFLVSWGPLRQWNPKFGWHKATATWFWVYGQRMWAATNLSYILDKFDDFWVGTSLGEAPLGFYSKAYEYARYPRRVVANPLITVFNPIFARLQTDRPQLSRAFYRSAYLIIRTGCLIAGVFALIMPEFIEFIIGKQWLPMLWTFRLMLIYTILDPFFMLIGNLFMVTGQPAQLQKAHFIQAIFFLPMVVLGAWLWRINGVAIAANSMLVLGTFWLYRPLRKTVDFSLRRLFLWPLIALGLGWSSGYWVEVALAENVIGALILKVGGFVVIFAGLLFVVERQDYIEGLRWFWQLFLKRRKLR